MAYWSCGISPARTAPALGEVEGDRIAVEGAMAHVRQMDLAGVTGHVGDTMRYALAGGGKRMRGLLLLSAYRAAGGIEDASGLAASVEIVHAYSLIHDDLPCMDDDDMRRGRPSAHVAFSVTGAAAAGAALIPLAAKVAHRAGRHLRLPEHDCCTIVNVLMRAAGAGGMIAGQVLDLEGEGGTLSRAALDRIHAAKTGALISAAVRMGGMGAGATAEKLDALERFGNCIGLAFQIMDDILDVTASTDRLGKTAGRDFALGKSTYPALLGVEGAIAEANSRIGEGCTALQNNGLLTAELNSLASFTVSRSH